MEDNLAAFQRAWGAIWAENLASRGLEDEGADAVRLDDSPAYPLARTVPLPEGLGCETGALSFRLLDLRLHGVSRLDAAGCRHESAGDRVRLRLLLPRVTLAGRYSIEVKPDPLIEIDTGGDLMDLPPEALRPAPAGAGPSGAGLDPEKEEWLDRARDQRTRLGETQNGQALLGMYNEHNETYNTVFQTRKALWPLWRAKGATREMSADTAGAVKEDQVVNDKAKLYSGGVTYNGNAFVQQLNVASACLFTDPDFDPRTGPPADSKFYKAAKAALSFGKGVSTTTNNKKDNVNEMKPSEVHATVEGHTGTLPEASDKEVRKLMVLGPGAAGADEDGEDGDLGWIVIDEEDRKRLRYLYEATMKEKAEDAAISGHPLFTGACGASIEGVEAEIELRLEDGPQGRLALDHAASLVLPAFEFDLDDTAWTGEAGQIARQRLERIYFIRSLLHDSIADHLRRALLPVVESAYNRASFGACM